jgi:hypothetical protein
MSGYGRYAQADLIGQFGGINIFRYVRDNPTNRQDRRGLIDFGDTMNRTVASPTHDTKAENDRSERRAYDTEIPCLLWELKGRGKCDPCRPIIKKRIKRAKEKRKEYE